MLLWLFMSFFGKWEIAKAGIEPTTTAPSQSDRPGVAQTRFDPRSRYFSFSGKNPKKLLLFLKSCSCQRLIGLMYIEARNKEDCKVRRQTDSAVELTVTKNTSCLPCVVGWGKVWCDASLFHCKHLTTVPLNLTSEEPEHLLCVYTSFFWISGNL